ncbi:MAG: hypothetical protein AB7U97_00035 [Pirellulales bacterium]
MTSSKAEVFDAALECERVILERSAGPANDRDAIGKRTLIRGCSSLYGGLRLARF